jgi:hypothetical protein
MYPSIRKHYEAALLAGYDAFGERTSISRDGNKTILGTQRMGSALLDHRPRVWISSCVPHLAVLPVRSVAAVQPQQQLPVYRVSRLWCRISPNLAVLTMDASMNMRSTVGHQLLAVVAIGTWRRQQTRTKRTSHGAKGKRDSAGKCPVLCSLEVSVKRSLSS